MTSPRPHENCYWLIPDKLLAGEYPGTRNRNETQARLAAYFECGVRFFLDLTELHENLQPYAPLLERLPEPVGYERWGVPDMDVPPYISLTNSILDRLDALLQTGTTTYLHCWGGIGRTGTLIGCWLVRQGHSPEQALDIIADRWRVMAKRDRYRHSPQTQQQFDYVLDWARHDRLLRDRDHAGGG